MALFNRKPKAHTAEDILKLIKELPEEEFDKLSDALLTDEDDNGKPDTLEEVEKAEEDIEAKGEDTQTEEDTHDSNGIEAPAPANDCLKRGKRTLPDDATAVAKSNQETAED